MGVPPVKIVYLITKSNWGGAQRYVYDMALGARAAGYDVAVGYGGGGLLAQKLREAGVRSVAIDGLGRDVGGGDIAAYKNIARFIRTERPQVLHLNSSKAAALGALAGRMAGVPRIVFTAHGWPFMERRNMVARGMIFLISWVTALLSHHVIAVSESERMLTRYMPPVGHKTVQIYNGIDLAMPFGTGGVIRSAFPAGARITGTVGELTSNKNQIALIGQARNDPAMYVAIVGEGELRGFLENKIKEYGLGARVKLFGFIPAAEVLKGFDTFALPSTKEALAYVVLEARAAGLPVVANRIGGIPEALDLPLSEFSIEKMVQKTLVLYRS